MLSPPSPLAVCDTANLCRLSGALGLGRSEAADLPGFTLAVGLLHQALHCSKEGSLGRAFEETPVPFKRPGAAAVRRPPSNGGESAMGAVAAVDAPIHPSTWNLGSSFSFRIFSGPHPSILCRSHGEPFGPRFGPGRGSRFAATLRDLFV